MPIYEYKCLKCKHQFEVIQRFSDDPVSKCPNCKNREVKKLVSAPSFRLKGGGWYETDFKTGSKKNIVDTKDEKQNQSKDKTKNTNQSKEKHSDKKT